MVPGANSIQNHFPFLDLGSSLGNLMIPESNKNERKNKSLKLAIMDQKIVQAGSKIKKWGMILNNNGPWDKHEPFLTSKNGEKRRRKIMGP